MEFMDIGTGILTVKTELAEDTDRLFSLVGDVLSGFLTSINVLTESNFNKLFVAESETINTWANYQRLIAMLVEQKRVIATMITGGGGNSGDMKKTQSSSGSCSKFDLGTCGGEELKSCYRPRETMALLLRSVTAAAASRAGACVLAESVISMGVRGFATKKTKKKGKKGGDDGNFEQMLRAIKGQYPDAEEWTEEEKQRHQEIGRVFNRMTSIEHNHLMRDLQTKIDLKWEAINALPAELQAEAMEIDEAPVPDGLTMATWTPPIPGFRRYTDEEADAQ
ncbi:hypothetical protein BBO99_00001678 [Phytophthora kernoviae]|uniref:Uncharacterized protein n=2 Tax=Phytophthora kernoviae TaxID=325452 RepID=A0A3R7JBG7_9STRA|nr:hypothetical protein G195_005066 [Phytophthora kernoviae 00238/432]KAG2525749.1 hypothetical protein JM16_003993 [Phytophthora kernoviae]KAG2527336.1 hypothetical protein JM18_003813 [Phytophthora kernoviae]RLN31875.1 hypothetical protein BBI17_000471 [Phytophthora kernoviae]RLN83963.1 hypothetical protein BBO99_00001678 [Phytophthora kernoviae]